MDWDESTGGVKYRAAQAANNKIPSYVDVAPKIISGWDGNLRAGIYFGANIAYCKC